jgi:hypothetical protein
MTLTRKGLLASGAAGAAALATASPALADRDRGRGHADDIVGSWYGRVTADDPALGSFEELLSFHSGGIVSDAHRLYIPATPFGPLLETSGHGAWKTTRNGYTAFFRFLLQQAPPSAGASVGTDNVRLNIRLDRSGNHFTGRFESTIRDTSGAAVFSVTGDVAGERIAA